MIAVCWTNTKEAFQSQFTLKYEVITLATSHYQYPVLQQMHQVMNPHSQSSQPIH